LGWEGEIASEEKGVHARLESRRCIEACGPEPMNETKQSIEEIWRAHGRPLYSFVLSIVLRCEDAEDVLQNVFLGILKVFGQKTAIRKMKPYLYRAARNEALRLLARRQRVNETIEPDALLLVAAPPGRHDEAIDLSRALTELPQEQREVVVLKIYHGMTFDEIADLTKESLNTVASRYRYGLQKLRLLLEDIKGGNAHGAIC